MAGIRELLSQYEARKCAGGMKNSLLQNDRVPNVVVQCLNDQLDTEIHVSSVQLVQWLCDLQDQQVDELRIFVLQFLPNIVMLYVNPTPNMEFNATVQVCIRNYLQLAENSRVFEKVQAPHIGRPSVYHKPSTDGPQPLTVSALQKHDHVELDTLHKKIDFKIITEENRLNFLNALVQIYTFYVSTMSHLSHLQYCHFCTRLSLQGMHYTASLVDTCVGDDCLSSSQLDKLASQKRHQLSPALLCSLLTGIQKIVFQYVNPSARQSLKAMDMRAKYELYPAAIQLSRSIRTLLEHVRSSKVNYSSNTNVLIDGLALTDPRFTRYPMLLSLLKFHSPSNNNEDNTISPSDVAIDVAEPSDSREKETEV